VTVITVVVLAMAYAVVGMIVVESARIWAGMWWIELRLSTVAFWPLILLAAVFGSHRP